MSINRGGWRRYGTYIQGLPQQLSSKDSACNTRDVGSIPGWGRSPEEENGNPLQYSCLGNSKDRGAWRATVHWVAEIKHKSATNQQQHIYSGIVILNIKRNEIGSFVEMWVDLETQSQRKTNIVNRYMWKLDRSV